VPLSIPNGIDAAAMPTSGAWAELGEKASL